MPHFGHRFSPSVDAANGDSRGGSDRASLLAEDSERREDADAGREGDREELRLFHVEASVAGAGRSPAGGGGELAVQAARAYARSY